MGGWAYKPSARRRFFGALALSACELLALFVMSGCVCWRSEDGTVHHLVLGVGIVSVKEAANRAMTVTDTHILGLDISNQIGFDFDVGYSARSVVAVSDGAEDVRAEVSKRPGAPLVVDVRSAKLKEADGSALAERGAK